MEKPSISKLIREAAEAFASLPGVGHKTAMRFVLHLLKQDPRRLKAFGEILQRLPEEVKYCIHCHNLTETEVCPICADARRDKSLICVVEDVRDVLALESTGRYHGLYHVLGGIISPMDGIGPKQLNIETLPERAKSLESQEIILALRTTMEGETTGFYLYKKLKDSGLRISTLARGIAVGDELEYADELTLGRSIANRTPFESTLSMK